MSATHVSVMQANQNNNRIVNDYNLTFKMWWLICNINCFEKHVYTHTQTRTTTKSLVFCWLEELQPCPPGVHWVFWSARAGGCCYQLSSPCIYQSESCVHILNIQCVRLHQMTKFCWLVCYMTSGRQLCVKQSGRGALSLRPWSRKRPVQEWWESAA